MVAEQIGALRDSDWAVREEAAAALGTLGDARAVLPLTRLLGDADRAVRTAAIGSLTALGPHAVDALGICLRDGSVAVQEGAAAVLAATADGRVLEPLIAALRSSDWIIRMHAATALGRIGDRAAVEPVLALLQDKVKAVREEAAAALAKIGEAAAATLIEALTHSDWLVRLHAIEALGKMRARPAVQPLLSVLFNDVDTSVRADAVRALGEIGDPAAVEFLLGVLKDRDLRPVAIEALGKIGDRRAVPALIDVVNGTSRPSHSRMVVGCGDGYDEEMLCTAAAVRSLGQIGDESCVPTLIAALQNTLIRSDASAALTKFGQPAITALLGVLKREQDGNIVYYAKEALAALGWRANRL